MKNNIVCLVLSLLCCYSSIAQPTIKIVEQGRKTSIRGMSVVNENIVWVSGSGGSVGKSIDGGKSWQWITVPGYEKRDFRDIEAFDENTALIMGIAEPAIILKTKDGGKNWHKVFEDSTKGMFLDAMCFTIEENQDTFAILIGDPIDSIQYLALSDSGSGDGWKAFPMKELKKMDTHNELGIVETGEAFFASSGTNFDFINLVGFGPIGFAVSGGKNTSLLQIPYGKKYSIPMIKGKESTGANSIAIFKEKNKGVIVGGDFTNDTLREGNMVLFNYKNGGLNPVFKKSSTPPHGYRSCVIYINEKNLITCGTSGVDISNDGGKNWQLISKESFHVVQKARNGKAVFLAGGGGRIGRLELRIKN